VADVLTRDGVTGVIRSYVDKATVLPSLFCKLRAHSRPSSGIHNEVKDEMRLGSQTFLKPPTHATPTYADRHRVVPNGRDDPCTSDTNVTRGFDSARMA